MSHMGDVELATLKAKVREQAARLQELERFRRLSEDPLPNLSHPSTLSSPSQLLDAYSSLYSRLRQTLQEKSQLEDALRSEMLQSEKQRAYIEVLKQALETQMGDIGAKDAKPRNDHQLAKLEQTLRVRDGKVAQLQAAVAEMQQTNQTLWKLENDLKVTKSALEDAEMRESQTLRENAELYKELEKKGNVEQQNTLLTESHQRLKALFEHTQKLATNYESRVAELENQVRDYESCREDLAVTKGRLKECEQQYLDCKADRDILRSAVDGLKTLKQRAETEAKVLSGQLEVMTKLKDSAQRHSDSANESLSLAEAETAHLRSRLSANDKRLREATERCDATDRRCQELNALYQKSQNDLKELRKDYESVVLELRRIKTTRDAESVVAAQEAEEAETLRSQLEAAQGQLTALKDETWICRRSLQALDHSRSAEEQLRKELAEARKTLAEHRGDVIFKGDDSRHSQ